MQTNKTRLAGALALAGALGLLQAVVAQAQFDWPTSEPGRTSDTLWVSSSSDVRDALSLWKRGVRERAVRVSRRALRHHDLLAQDKKTALYIVCAGEAELGRPDAALPFCERAVRLSRSREWWHLGNRGNALLGSGRTADAMADYESALALLEEQRARESRDSLDGSLQTAKGVLEANLALALRRQDPGSENAAATPLSESKSPSETRLADGTEPQP